MEQAPKIMSFSEGIPSGSYGIWVNEIPIIFADSRIDLLLDVATKSVKCITSDNNVKIDNGVVLVLTYHGSVLVIQTQHTVIEMYKCLHKQRGTFASSQMQCEPEVDRKDTMVIRKIGIYSDHEYRHLVSLEITSDEKKYANTVCLNDESWRLLRLVMCRNFDISCIDCKNGYRAMATTTVTISKNNNSDYVRVSTPDQTYNIHISKISVE